MCVSDIPGGVPRLQDVAYPSGASKKLELLASKVFTPLGLHNAYLYPLNKAFYTTESSLKIGPRYGSSLKDWSTTCNRYSLILLRDNKSLQFKLVGRIFNQVRMLIPPLDCMAVVDLYEDQVALYYYYLVWVYICNQGVRMEQYSHAIGAKIEAFVPPSKEVQELMRIACLDRGLAEEEFIQ